MDFRWPGAGFPGRLDLVIEAALEVDGPFVFDLDLEVDRGFLAGALGAGVAGADCKSALQGRSRPPASGGFWTVGEPEKSANMRIFHNNQFPHDF